MPWIIDLVGSTFLNKYLSIYIYKPGHSMLIVCIIGLAFNKIKTCSKPIILNVFERIFIKHEEINCNFINTYHIPSIYSNIETQV